MKIVNANWVAGPDGDHGRFEIQIVTEDDQRHVAAPDAAAMTALIALTQADTVLAWDPADRTLIAANLVGRMPWTERTPSSPPPADAQPGGWAMSATVARTAWIRSPGAISISSPRRPPLQKMVPKPRAEESITTGSRLRCPSGEIPPTT